VRLQLYESRGVDPAVAGEMAAEMMRTPELALETHAREELGVSPHNLGNPYAASSASAASFAVGALVPLVPWFFTSGGSALALSLILGAVAAVVIGLALARFSGRSPLRLVVRQLIVTIAAAGVTFLVGKAVGTNLT